MFSFSIAPARNSKKTLIFGLLVCLSVHAFAFAVTQGEPSSYPEEFAVDVKRSDFPADFVFGVATAAAQIEGSARSGGKGPSILDDYIHKFPDKIIDRSNLDVAIDSYNRYKEDVLALKHLGVNAYKFSIPWTRILPNGTLSGGINQEGIDHYNRLIDELIKHGIKPFVTLLHFDTPQALQDKYGCFLSRNIVKDFKNYAEICFKTFGDRVKHWFTINELIVTGRFGYTLGIVAPGRCSDRKFCPDGNSFTEPYIVVHNLLLAHATVAKLYKEKYQAKQGGSIGITHVAQYYEPYSNTPDDKLAAKRGMDFDFGWFMEPLVRGEYPLSMRKMVKDRLPVFTDEEKNLVKGSFDFISLNYYTSRYAKNIPSLTPDAPVSAWVADSMVNITVENDGGLIGPKANGSQYIYIYPNGLHKMLEFVKKNYGENITIYISENGVTEQRNDSIPINQVLNDQHRIEYIKKHLQQIPMAIANGVKVKGYFHWSLFDDFEYMDGYTCRFGLYYIDYKNNLKRIPKKSVKWYHDFIKGCKK